MKTEQALLWDPKGSELHERFDSADRDLEEVTSQYYTLKARWAEDARGRQNVWPAIGGRWTVVLRIQLRIAPRTMMHLCLLGISQPCSIHVELVGTMSGFLHMPVVCGRFHASGTSAAGTFWTRHWDLLEMASTMSTIAQSRRIEHFCSRPNLLCIIGESSNKEEEGARCKVSREDSD
jgi:hypothetical protein